MYAYLKIGSREEILPFFYVIILTIVFNYFLIANLLLTLSIIRYSEYKSLRSNCGEVYTSTASIVAIIFYKVDEVANLMLMDLREVKTGSP